MARRIKKTVIFFLKIFRFITRNLLRVLFAFAAIAAAAAIILWFTALKYFNAEYVGTILTAALQKALNRPVAMESIKLVSLNAVEIINLKIIDNNADIYDGERLLMFSSYGGLTAVYKAEMIENGMEIKLKSHIMLDNRENGGINDDC